jgi:hypothetical protein
MVKHSVLSMEKFFSRERFGQPQFLAGIMLLMFLAQCGWLVEHSFSRFDVAEDYRIHEGLRQLHGGRLAGIPPATQPFPDDDANPATWFFTADGFDPHHSPLWYLTGSSGLLLWPKPLEIDSLRYWGWLARMLYLVFGALLGASLWYVARRLYGNAGGYTALSLYCFSPGIIRATSLWGFTQPEIGAAWGTFGTIFTAIAVAHTLYAPREVVLWNWRRILLLGVSIALAIGSQFSLLIIIPMALALMYYVAPTRRLAATVIWASASGIGLLLLFASYWFHSGVFLQSLRHASFFGGTWRSFLMPGAYGQLAFQLAQSSPALVAAVPAAVVTYLAWPRARYFGNTAPLLVALIFLVMALATPHYPGLGFNLIAVPFLFVFVAGITADLLETPQRNVVLSCIFGLLVANGIWNLWELARASAG